MKIKSMPKQCINPTITFDRQIAQFDDLLVSIQALDLPLDRKVSMYLSNFNILFFNQEMSGQVLLTFWNDLTLGFDSMPKIYDQDVKLKQDLTLEELGDALVVYDPPVYCFYTANPFKYLNKRTIDRKIYYFRKGLELLFHVRPQPTFYPF